MKKEKKTLVISLKDFFHDHFFLLLLLLLLFCFVLFCFIPLDEKKIHDPKKKKINKFYEINKNILQNEHTLKNYFVIESNLNKVHPKLQVQKHFHLFDIVEAACFALHLYSCFDS
jgi:hypothetical protein